MLPLRQNLGAAGRNVGVHATTTPYVAFCDDDSRWEPGALRLAADRVDENPDLALVAARVLVGPDRELDPTCEAMATSPLPESTIPGRPVLGFLGCGAVVRRRAFLGAGGFDPRYGVGGEKEPLAVELAAQGWALSYLDGVTAVHLPSIRRDRADRRRTLVRNRLWTAWALRRLRAALRTTVAVAWRSLGDTASRAGLVDALRGAPAVLRSRRPFPRDLERRLQLLD